MKHFYFLSMNRTNNYIVFAAGPTTEKGGSAAYVRELTRELSARSYTVTAVHYRLFRSVLPGMRQLAYLRRLIAEARGATVIMAVDTWSTGIPALITAKCTGARLVLRVGGDFLWEQYTERTGELTHLSSFYTSPLVRLSLKERVIFQGTRLLLKYTDVIAFNTAWQQSLWHDAYQLNPTRTCVIENRYPRPQYSVAVRSNIFVSAGRAMRLKNKVLLEKVFTRAKERHPEFTLDTRQLPETEHAERLRTCRAVIQASVSDISPNAVIEAASFGTPFICTNDTGITDRLQGRGIFVDTTDEEALLAAIIALMDPNTYGDVTARTQAPGNTRDWNAVADDFEKVFISQGLEHGFHSPIAGY